jgi:hypothetical protein
VRTLVKQGWYFTVASLAPERTRSTAPTYATQVIPTFNDRL